MALTQAQQQLADIAQAGEANACCIARGGTIFTDAMTGIESCGFGQQLFTTNPTTPGLGASESYTSVEPLSGQCGAIQSSLPAMPSPDGNGQGNFLGNIGQGINNFFGFVGENFQELAQTYQNLTGDNQQGQTGNTTIIVQPEDEKPDLTILYIVGGAILLLVIILLIRKMRK